MKKVAIEMEKLSNLNSGLGQFCFNLGNAITAQKAKDLKIRFRVPKKCVGILGKGAEYKKVNPLNKIFRVKSSETDVWHCTHQQSRILPASKKTKLILTIHDLNFLEKYKISSKQRQKLKKVQKLVDRASAITVISEYTKKLVLQHLEIGDKPVSVIYNGNTLKPVQAIKPSWLPDDPYIFSIGIINPKKNFHVLLSLLKSFPKLNLVIAGNADHSYAEKIKGMAKAEGVSDRLILPGIINDATRYSLYQHCEAFAFPSLTEGFGLPVIEAMSMGKPVFLSEFTSLKEVGGTEAFYWKSFDPHYMAEVYEKGMEEFSSDPAKKKRIKKWAEKFTWEEAAKKYLELYRSV